MAHTLNNIIETTLIGTGGGYGESIVVHLGNQNWIVVDSCINPITGKSLALEYLKENDVSLKTDVKLIVCTHWHDDHIKGISQLLMECKSAVFSMALASDRQKFLRMVGLDQSLVKIKTSATSTKEINDCLSILKKRHTPFKAAVQDKVLFSFSDDDINSVVISLSPSDAVIEAYNLEISKLITDFGQSNRKIIVQSPNNKSVVLYIKINDQTILLGSDLEVTKDCNKGWSCIINESQTVNSKANIFKIPHHGSETAYDKQIWDVLIADNAISKLTPFNRGTDLPTSEMLDILKKHTDNLYITSNKPSSKKAKKRDKSIEKIINKFNPTLTEVKFHQGIVKCSYDITDTNQCEWDITLQGAAEKI